MTDCSYHDQSFSESCYCVFHFSADEHMAQFFNSNVKLQNDNNLEPIVLPLLFPFLKSVFNVDTVVSSAVDDCDRFSLIEWGGVSCSLRAPPILV